MANRYWVGGTGTWDTTSTANWSATSGGAAGASAPTAADIAFFDANSGTGTATLGEPVTVLRLTMTGYAGTLAFSTHKISLVGNNSTIFTGSPTCTATGSKLLEFTYSGASGTRSVDSGATITEANAMNISATAGTDIFRFIVGTGKGYGSIDFTGFAGTYAVNSTGVFPIYGNLTLSTAMTMASTVSNLQMSGTGQRTIISNGKTFDQPFVMRGANGVYVFADAFTQAAARAFVLEPSVTVRLKAGTTNVVGLFNTLGTAQKFLQSDISGSAATLSQPSGTVNATYLTIKDIIATGGATWNAFVTENNVNDGGNTGWDFFTQVGRYMYNVRKSKRILI
jgi:hypothetical protein